jgi:hypothetical protein
MGYRGTDGVTVFTDVRALPLAKMHRWNPETRRKSAKSWPTIVVAAVTLGWSGNTSSPSQPTFVHPEEF